MNAELTRVIEHRPIDKEPAHLPLRSLPLSMSLGALQSGSDNLKASLRANIQPGIYLTKKKLQYLKYFPRYESFKFNAGFPDFMS